MTERTLAELVRDPVYMARHLAECEFAYWLERWTRDAAATASPDVLRRAEREQLVLVVTTSEQCVGSTFGPLGRWSATIPVRLSDGIAAVYA